MTALELTDVRKVYQSGDEEVVALDHARLSVADDEMVALVGPSGSGKTTLISIAGGLLRASEGGVVVGGEDITHYDAKRLTRFRGRRVGFVFQSVNLVPFLTAARTCSRSPSSRERVAPNATAPSSAPTNSSTSSESANAATTSPPSCRAVSASGSRSGARS